MRNYLLLFMLSFMVVGCVAPSNQLYEWQDYSHSLYELEKEPSDESYANHKTTLHAIIDNAETKGIKSPPGVCCELGHLYAKEGEVDEAVKYYEMEKELFPESQVFVNKLIDAAKLN